MISRVPEPGIDAVAQVGAAVIVAEVIVVIAQADEEVVVQAAITDCIPGPVKPTRRVPKWSVKIGRREQQSAVYERVIPIAAAEFVAIRRPVVIRGNPNLIVVRLGPVAIAIGVAVIAVKPGARNVGA